MHKVLQEAFLKNYLIENIKGNIKLSKSNKKFLVFKLNKDKNLRNQLNQFTKIAKEHRDYHPFVIINNKEDLKDCVKYSKWHFSFGKIKDLIL